MSVTVITDSTLQSEVLAETKKAVLVDFWAQWYGPCKMLAPGLSAISEKRSDDIKICKIDVDSNIKSAKDFQISSIPCCIVFQNGKEIGRIIGHRTEAGMNDEITKIIGKA